MPISKAPLPIQVCDQASFGCEIEVGQRCSCNGRSFVKRINFTSEQVSLDEKLKLVTVSAAVGALRIYTFSIPFCSNNSKSVA